MALTTHFFTTGSSRCAGLTTEQLPADSKSCLERPSDLHGDDPRHPYVHGPSLCAAE